jgi:hypothetical protein
MRGEQKFTPGWGARQSEKQELKIIPVSLRQRLGQVIMRLSCQMVEEKIPRHPQLIRGSEDFFPHSRKMRMRGRVQLRCAIGAD